MQTQIKNNILPKHTEEKLKKLHQLLADSKDFQVRTRQDIDTQIANERDNWNNKITKT